MQTEKKKSEEENGSVAIYNCYKHELQMVTKPSETYFNVVLFVVCTRYALSRICVFKASFCSSKIFFFSYFYFIWLYYHVNVSFDVAVDVVAQAHCHYGAVVVVAVAPFVLILILRLSK